MQRIILFGDEILGGVYHNQVTETFTKRIALAFPEAEVINLSIPGHKTTDALTHVNRDLVALDPTIVILGFGVNDVSIHDEIKPGFFTNNLTSLIQTIGTSRVILLSPPYTDYHHHLNHNWPRQLQFTLAAEHVAHKLQVPFINLLKSMQQQNNPQQYLQADGLHFNEDGFDLLFDLLQPILKHALTTAQLQTKDA